MNLQKLTNAGLETSFGKLVQTERKITSLVLKYIIEIESRKLYLEKTYRSIYAFLVEGYGYSQRLGEEFLLQSSQKILLKSLKKLKAAL